MGQERARTVSKTKKLQNMLQNTCNEAVYRVKLDFTGVWKDRVKIPKIPCLA